MKQSKFEASIETQPESLEMINFPRDATNAMDPRGGEITSRDTFDTVIATRFLYWKRG